MQANFGDPMFHNNGFMGKNKHSLSLKMVSHAIILYSVSHFWAWQNFTLSALEILVQIPGHLFHLYVTVSHTNCHFKGWDIAEDCRGTTAFDKVVPHSWITQNWELRLYDLDVYLKSPILYMEIQKWELNYLSGISEYGLSMCVFSDSCFSHWNLWNFVKQKGVVS